MPKTGTPPGIWRGGLLWQCKEPRALWATDPEDGWELYFVEENPYGPPSWFLTGPGVEYDTGCGKSSFRAALRQAARYIQENAT